MITSRYKDKSKEDRGSCWCCYQYNILKHFLDRYLRAIYPKISYNMHKYLNILISTMTKTAAWPSGHGVLSRHHRLLPSYLEMVHRPALWSRPGVLWSSVERSGVLRAGQCGLIWSTVEHCLVYCAPIPWCQFEPQHWWSSLGVLITDQLTTLPCLNNHTFSEQKLLKGSKRQVLLIYLILDWDEV